MSTELIPKYKEIYKILTKRPWEGCLCGGGFIRLYKTCLNGSLDTEKLNKIYKN